jgi:hypothetical protein
LNLLDVALVYSQLYGQSDSAPRPSPLATTLSSGNSQSPDIPVPLVPLVAEGISSHSAFRIPHSPIGAPSRAYWYTLSACRFHLGLQASDQLLNGLRPARVSLAEKLIHRAATRGWLPELARHLYLWFALPREDRFTYLKQSIAVGRSALWPVTQRAEGCPKD